MRATPSRQVPLRPLMAVAVTLSVFAAACGGEVGSRPAKWSYISTEIIQPSCATSNCHSKITQRSGVQLDTIRDGYEQLLGRHFVAPGMPDSSGLVGLIEGQGSLRMPPDFALPLDDITVIRAWIMAGAAYDGPGTAPVMAFTDNAGAGN